VIAFLGKIAEMASVAEACPPVPPPRPTGSKAHRHTNLGGTAPGKPWKNNQGLKARLISRADDASGLQPSGKLGDREPGALPQAADVSRLIIFLVDFELPHLSQV